MAAQSGGHATQPRRPYAIETHSRLSSSGRSFSWHFAVARTTLGATTRTGMRDGGSNAPAGCRPPP